MYLTPDNAHELIGRSLDASKRILGAYPYTVIQFPDGTYGAMDRVGVCIPVSNDRFNQVWFDIIDGKSQTEREGDVMTNADVIRKMTDDELYKFLQAFEIGDIDYSLTFCSLCKDTGLDCDECFKRWLFNDAHTQTARPSQQVPKWNKLTRT